MSDAPDGTFAKLMELSETSPAKPPTQAPRASTMPVKDDDVTGPAEQNDTEDITTTPYISQNYRFTDDELRWLRKRSFDLTDQVGSKVSQNTILRIALRELRDVCERNPKSNPLSKAISRLKK